MIAVKETTPDNPYALQWINENGTLKQALNAKAFSQSIYDRIGWKKEYSFKFRGITRIRGNGKILIFYLDEPQIIPNKKKATDDDLTESSETPQYIPYKEPKEEQPSPINRKMIVSETWKKNENFGISLLLSKKRDWIVHSISEQDIATKGILVDNPLIGSLPSQTEILDELDNLIASM